MKLRTECRLSSLIAENRRMGRIFTLPSLCFVFGWTRSGWCIMSCWKRVKPSQGIGIERNWCLWVEHWRRNGHSTKRDMTKLSSSMTTLGHMSQDRSRHTWKRWNRRFYFTRCTLQTLLLPTTICFDRWQNAWLIIISALIKKSKNRSIRGSSEKTHRFFMMVSDNCQKDRKK